MGKEWYNWPGKGERAGSSDRGCISGMLHLLDFHHFLFAASSGRTVQTMAASPPPVSTSPQLKGVEAPRNSLELDEIAAYSGASDHFYDIPLGIQLVPSTPSSLACEEPRNSQSGTPRTPNLVARLMGLELLPDSPLSITPPSMKNKVRCLKNSTNNKKQKMNESRNESTTPPRRQPLQPRNCNIGSRSLPETPRASSVRSMDVVPRLSLQLNKENNVNHNRSAMQEFSYLYEVYSPDSPSPLLSKTKKKDTRQQDENRSSHTHYREIVKNVKESVTSRRVGGGGNECGVNSRRTRKPERKAQEVKPPPSCSPPAIRFLDSVRSNRVGSAVHPKKTTVQKTSSESFPKGMKKRPSKQEKLAIAEKNQKISSTIHSWDVVVPIPRPAQRERNKIIPQNSHSQGSPEGLDCEFRYVRSVLEHAGLITREPHSINLPLKPTIFHHLELDINVQQSRCHQWQSEASVSHRWNRRLLFHLVDEILGDIAGDGRGCVNGEDLILRVWTQIRNYPAVDCQVVGDIDTLIERDLPEEKVRGLLRHPGVVAEAELVAVEIEQAILDSLVGEAAKILAVISCYSSRNGRR